MSDNVLEDDITRAVREQFDGEDALLFYPGDDTHERKLDALQGLLESEGLDAALLFTDDKIRYATDFYTKGFGPFLRIEYCCLVPREGKPILGFSNESDIYRARAFDLVDDVRKLPGPLSAGSSDGWADVITTLLDDYDVDGTVGTDLLPYHLQSTLDTQVGDIEFVDVEPIWKELTEVKTDAEVEIMRDAVDIAEAGMEAAIEAVEPGRTEIEVTAIAEKALRERNAEFTPFISDIAAGENTALFTRVPSTDEIQDGDVVFIDLGAIYKGYTAEYARTVVAGEPNETQREIYGVVYESLQNCIDAIEPGATCHEVDQAAREVIRDAGYGKYEHTRHTGHQLGYGLHGAPLIDEGVEETLEPGMVVSVEPRITLYDRPDVGAIQLEDTVLVTEDGSERLTQTEYDSTLLD